MLPTLPIPAVARVESSTPPPGSAPDADGDTHGAFSTLLQRAQAEPAASAAEPRAKLPHGSEQHGKALAGDAKHGARAEDQRTEAERARVDDESRDDARAVDPTAVATRGESADAAADVKPSAAPSAPDGVPTTPAWFAIALDTVAAPHAAHDVSRGAIAQAAPDDDAIAATTALDHRSAPAGRTMQRSGAHDARTLAAGAAVSAGDPEQANDATARAALASHAEVERAASDAHAGATASTRALMPERAPVDAAAAAAVIAMREPDGGRTTDKLSGPAHEAKLRASIGDADFGGALGTQVALWVRDGVQEARLQLHPAELGPVNVQIALDGQLAHVDFAAAAPATRESIEQSLPALAAALRDAGFTLAGGGVSGQAAQHGGQGRRDGASGGNREFGTRGGAVDGGDAATPAPRRWTRSLLDVYA